MNRFKWVALAGMLAEVTLSMAPLVRAGEVRGQQGESVPETAAAGGAVDGVLARQEKAIQAASAKATPTIKERILLLQVRQARAVTEGITKARPFAQRVLFLYADDHDREMLAKCAAGGLKWLTGLDRDTKAILEDADRDDEAKIMGWPKLLDRLECEIALSEAWMRLYLRLGSPPSGDKKAWAELQAKGDALAQTQAFRTPQGRKKGVLSQQQKSSSLLLAVIAAREAGHRDHVQERMVQMLVPASESPFRTQAMFEIARGAIESGDLSAGLAAVGVFRKEALASKTLPAETIDLLSALLERHACQRQAHTGGIDEVKALACRVQGTQALLNFAEKHAKYRADVAALVERTFRGQDPRSLPAAVRDMAAKGRDGGVAGFDAILDAAMGPFPVDLHWVDEQSAGPANLLGNPGVFPASHVVYCVETSKPAPDCTESLNASIRDLVDAQTLHVVCFSGDTCEQNPPRRLVPATELDKSEAMAFLHGFRWDREGQASSPIPALTAAFEAFKTAPSRPGKKVLFLLTGGDFARSAYKGLAGGEAVRAWLRDHNADKSVHVCPIVLGKKPSKETEQVMRRIATENGGTFSYVER